MVMTYRTGAVGTPGAAKVMAAYLMEKGRKNERVGLAQYYTRGAGSVPNVAKSIDFLGKMVADGAIPFDEALTNILQVHAKLGALPAGEDGVREEGRVADMMADVVRFHATSDANAQWALLPYYERAVARGAGASPEVTRILPTMGRLVADGVMGFGDAADTLISEEIRAGYNGDDLAHEARITDALSTIAALNADGKAGAGMGDNPEEVIGALPEVRADIHPDVAQVLGLDPKVTPTEEQIANILSGKRADGSDLAGHQRSTQSYQSGGEGKESRARIAFVDFTFSADKSVAIAWAFAPTEAERAMIVQCHRAAVEAAMRYIEKEIGIARKGAGGKDGAEPGRIGWIQFDHFTSRPTVAIAQPEKETGVIGTTLHDVLHGGDMLVHTHVATPNVVVTDTGRVGSLRLAKLQDRVHEFGAYYHAVLARELRAIGVHTVLDTKTGAARIVGIGDDLRREFSKRTVDAEETARALAERVGLKWDDLQPWQQINLLKRGAEITRLGKNDSVSDFEFWEKQARDIGYVHKSVLSGSSNLPEMTRDERLDMALDVAITLLERDLERQSVLEVSAPRVAAARGLVAAGVDGPEDINAITAAMRHFGIRQAGRETNLIWGEDAKDGKVRITTGLHEAWENELVQRTQAAMDRRAFSLTPEQIEASVQRAIKSGQLDPNREPEHWALQRDAIERVGTAGDLAVLVGVAGSGKTTLLKPLVSGWREQGVGVYGIALAWRQSDPLDEAGIKERHTRAIDPFLKEAAAGKLAFKRGDVIVVDEIGQVGIRQFLQLLRLQVDHGVRLVVLGDDKQCQAIEAGPVIALLRRALGNDAIPEIASSIRQFTPGDAARTKRDRYITGLFRDGKADEAIKLKREDGTIALVGGGKRDFHQAVAAHWAARMEANKADPKFSVSVSAPSNAEARAIAVEIRKVRREMGKLGADAKTVKAIDQLKETYDLAIAVGDKVRLFSHTNAALDNGRRGLIGRNGNVVEVLDVKADGLRVRNHKGTTGFVRWTTLQDKDTGRIKLAYGDCMTIDAIQGATTRGEHIDALPGGSKTVHGFKAYTAESRSTLTTWLFVSEGAERKQIADRRPLGDTREITREDLFANIGKNLSEQPEKASSLAFIDRAVQVHRGALRSLAAGLQPMQKRQSEGKEETTLHSTLQEVRETQVLATLADKLERAVLARAPRLARLVKVMEGLRAARRERIKAKQAEQAAKASSAVQTPPAQGAEPKVRQGPRARS